jgi:hypothetical protein
MFLEQQSRKYSDFDNYIPLWKQGQLLQAVQDKVPDRLGRLPSWKEIYSVQMQLQNGVVDYLRILGRKMPKWFSMEILSSLSLPPTVH